MKSRDFFLLIFAVALGSLAALLVWTLIVKSQLTASLGSNSTLNTVLSLFGSNATPSS
jgi:hypothetical protein